MKPTFKKPTFKKPTFAGLKPKPLPSLGKAPDPLKGVKMPDDVEGAAETELDAVQKGFRERAAQEAQRFEDATDTGYYACLVAENRAQLEAFLSAIGMLNKGDLYLDVREVARNMGIELPKASSRGGSVARIDKAFAAMVRD